MTQQNTALIDDIMAALDAESSQNVELIVRNTQNGATKKMALASLEQIIYSYLTTAPVVSNLASVLGATKTAKDLDIISLNNGTYAVYSTTTGAPVTPLLGDIVVVSTWNIETKSFIYFTTIKKIYVGYKLYNENSITWKQLSYAAP